MNDPKTAQLLARRIAQIKRRERKLNLILNLSLLAVLVLVVSVIGWTLTKL